MKRVIYLITIFLLLFTSCEKEDLVNVGRVEEVNLSFKVSDYSGESLSLQSKSVAVALDETTVDDIWILQFDRTGANNGSGKMVVATTRYVENVKQVNQDYTFTASIKLGSPQILYLVANTGNKELYLSFTSATTEQDFLNKLILAKASELGNAENSGHLVRVGKQDGTIRSVNNIGQIYIGEANTPTVLKLENRLAKIDFEYIVAENLRHDGLRPNEEYFKVTAINLRNSPFNTTISTPSSESELGSYTDIKGGNSESLTPIFDSSTDMYTKEYVFYTPERIGGIEGVHPGSLANLQESEKFGDFDNNGLADGEKKFTHIEIEGIRSTFHMNKDGNYPANPLNEKVLYKIYLGEDNFNNYNVIAGKNYIVTAKINTISAGDNRISITTTPTPTP